MARGKGDSSAAGGALLFIGLLPLLLAVLAPLFWFVAEIRRLTATLQPGAFD